MTQPSLAHVPEDWTRALAIVAHPDDLEYGTASAIAKWTRAGKEITYLLVSRGEAGIDAWPPTQTAAVREAEERESARRVGVETVEFLVFPDGVIEYGLPLRRDLARAIRQYRPEVLLLINFDLTWAGGVLNQADHRAVGLAACDAARDAANRWIFPELAQGGLEPWRGTRWLFVSGVAEPTHACDLGDALSAGIASLQAHHAYLTHLAAPLDPETFLRDQATQMGAQLGCAYAVGFRVLQL